MVPRFVFWWQLVVVVWHLAGDGQAGLRIARAIPEKKEGLYSNQDDVIILNSRNLRDRIYGKSMVWVVEFYNSWCGHCVKFAPTYKEFASDLKGWRRVVSVGAIDCANNENLPICRDYDIQGYPNMKLIPPNFMGEKSGSKENLKSIQTQALVEMKDAVLDFIINPDFPIPPTWPRLTPLESVADIWDEAREEHKFIVLIFEEELSVLGAEVILDLVDYPSILVRRIQKKNVDKFGITKYPSLYIINKDSSFQHLASGTGLLDSDRHKFVDRLVSLLGLVDSKGERIKINHQGDTAGRGGGAVVQFELPKDGKPALIPPVSTGSVGVHMQDLESALHYALRQEIAICKTIQGPKLDALHTFVSILAKYFPGRPEVTRFLWKLAEYLREKDARLTGEIWITAIDKLQDDQAFLPDRVRWVGCKGSEPGYRGYPCSMWTLFHTLTVAAYESNGVNAQEVPLAIRGYMEHFFGCQECSKNFIKMATNLEQEIHTPVDAVLWLWTAHNKANKRLHGDPSEDPDHPKIQFPSKKDCAKCRSSDSDSNPGWNFTEVSAFLRNFYGKDSIIQDVADMGGGGVSKLGDDDQEMDWWEKHQRETDLKKIRALRARKRKERLENRVHDGEAIQKREVIAVRDDLMESEIGGAGRRLRPLREDGWGLSQLDVGVCMMFYVACAAIILILYYHFIVQKRFRVPCSNCSPV